MIQTPKSQLRQQLLQLRQNLTDDQVKQKSQLICKQISQLDIFKNTQHILFYHPQESEVNLLPLIQEHPEKNWYLPQLKPGHTFAALPFHSEDFLKKNQYGILEPIPKENQSYDHLIQLTLIPGLAFDLQGNRLGRGKGYYDRYFAQWPHSLKIGVVYDFQILQKLPQELYDVPVNEVLTDERILKIL